MKYCITNDSNIIGSKTYASIKAEFLSGDHQPRTVPEHLRPSFSDWNYELCAKLIEQRDDSSYEPGEILWYVGLFEDDGSLIGIWWVESEAVVEYHSGEMEP